MTGYAVVRSHVQSLVVAGGVFPWVDQLEGAFPEIKARAGLTGDHLDPPGHGKPQRAW